MPLVAPFTGLVFDPSHVGSLERVTAPPYDSISSEQERRLHSASPHNVVRLILGRDRPGDDEFRNKYTRAAERLRTWLEHGALRETDGPCWFPYEMRFTFQGAPRRVRSLICRVALEALGGSIIPHERTLPGPIEDRLQLLRSVAANLSPVYALFRGPCRPLAAMLEDAANRAPDRYVLDEQGTEHRMWIVPGDQGAGVETAGIAAWLRDEQLMIADGHHRYRVALAHREQMRARHGAGPWDHMMMLLVDAATEDPPVLPIHRLVLDGHSRLDGAPVRDLAEVLAAVDDDALVYGSVSTESHRLVHRVASLEGEPPTVRLLHERVLGDIPLRFTPDAAAAEGAVRAGEATAAFFLPPTRVDRIRDVVERREQLPQKSTYFWPKPRTGMVIRPLV
jgi:uncharacterized protein (DUF1015 family)